MGEKVTYVSDTAPEFRTTLTFGKGDDRERAFHNWRKSIRLDGVQIIERDRLASHER